MSKPMSVKKVLPTDDNALCYESNDGRIGPLAGTYAFKTCGN
jgi:hypothetical protein